jgi:hypothetical protein
MDKAGILQLVRKTTWNPENNAVLCIPDSRKGRQARVETKGSKDSGKSPDGKARNLYNN